MPKPEDVIVPLAVLGIGGVAMTGALLNKIRKQKTGGGPMETESEPEQGSGDGSGGGGGGEEAPVKGEPTELHLEQKPLPSTPVQGSSHRTPINGSDRQITNQSPLKDMLSFSGLSGGGRVVAETNNGVSASPSS